LWKCQVGNWNSGDLALWIGCLTWKKTDNDCYFWFRYIIYYLLLLIIIVYYYCYYYFILLYIIIIVIIIIYYLFICLFIYLFIILTYYYYHHLSLFIIVVYYLLLLLLYLYIIFIIIITFLWKLWLIMWLIIFIPTKFPYILRPFGGLKNTNPGDDRNIGVWVSLSVSHAEPHGSGWKKWVLWPCRRSSSYRHGATFGAQDAEAEMVWG
jgi:O-antigen ligase